MHDSSIIEALYKPRRILVRTILPPHEPASERGCVEDQPQRVATFAAAAAGAPLPRTQPRSVCQSV
ncbi:MAG TPA: hypothetical protein VMF08_23505, partial [Candidatus Sulfotelmatobacter sp.]|nr:hypothetical protein [Candidatus Sulfotelmatobacter sp.]